jgi:hypothetical protein
VASNYGANEFQQLLDPSITTILRSAFFWTSIPATGGPVPLCVWSKVQRNPDTGQLALTAQARR